MTWAGTGRVVGAVVVALVIGIVGWAVWATAFFATAHGFDRTQSRTGLEQVVVTALPVLTVVLGGMAVASYASLTRWRGVVAFCAVWATAVLIAQLLSHL